MKSSLPLLVTVLATTTGCGGGCGPTFNDDTCADPEIGVATRIEIGTTENGPFEAWADGTVVQTVIGGQGGTMIPVSLRLTGSGVPACLRQSTRVLRYTNDDLIDSNASGVRTYEQDDGTRTTKSLYMVMNYLTNAGDAVHINATAAGQSADVVVFLDFAGESDAAVPDAGPAADAGVDGGADAAILDAGADAGTTDATAADAS